MVENNIITSITNGLQALDTTFTIGMYPYDFKNIGLKLPAVLFKYGDSIISSIGKGQYLYQLSTQVICFYNKLDQIQSTQDDIIKVCINSLNKNTCTYDVGDIIIQTGDIGDFMTPSSPGYNANMIVRKLTLNYTINRIIN